MLDSTFRFVKFQFIHKNINPLKKKFNDFVHQHLSNNIFINEKHAEIRMTRFLFVAKC